jgi:hypothetical protein
VTNLSLRDLSLCEQSLTKCHSREGGNPDSGSSGSCGPDDDSSNERDYSHWNKRAVLSGQLVMTVRIKPVNLRTKRLYSFYRQMLHEKRNEWFIGHIHAEIVITAKLLLRRSRLKVRHIRQCPFKFILQVPQSQ